MMKQDSPNDKQKEEDFGSTDPMTSRQNLELLDYFGSLDQEQRSIILQNLRAGQKAAEFTPDGEFKKKINGYNHCECRKISLLPSR